MESQVGYERLFDPQDVFFSTTDLKGVIQNTNRTFDTLSRYSRDRLIGSPHNIIRHLDMPSGLYRLIWDDLNVPASGLRLHHQPCGGRSGLPGLRHDRAAASGGTSQCGSNRWTP